MKSIVANDSNSFGASSIGSPYSKRHPRRKSQINKISEKQVESVSIVAAPMPVDSTVLYKRNDEIVEFPDNTTTAGSVVFNIGTPQSSPNLKQYAAARYMR